MDAQPASLSAPAELDADPPPVEALDRAEVEAMIGWLMTVRHELVRMMSSRYRGTLNADDIQDAFGFVALGLVRAAETPANSVHAVWRDHQSGETSSIRRYVTTAMGHACETIRRRSRGEVVMPHTGEGRALGLIERIDARQHIGMHEPDVADLALGGQENDDTVRRLESGFIEHLPTLPHFDELWITVFRLHRAGATERQIAQEVGRLDVRRQVKTVDGHWRRWALRQGFVAPGARR